MTEKPNDSRQGEEAAESAGGANGDLRRQLLQQQIIALRRQNSRGWMWYMGAVVVAIVASLTASTIFSVIVFMGARVLGREVVEVYEARVVAARGALEEAAAAREDLADETAAAVVNLAQVEARRMGALNRARAAEDFVASGSAPMDPGIGIQIEDQGYAYFLAVESYPQGALLMAFDGCRGNFVFPDEFPDLESCDHFFDATCEGTGLVECSSGTCTAVSPCRFGPIGKMGTSMINSVWVSATLEGRTTVQRVHLDGR